MTTSENYSKLIFISKEARDKFDKSTYKEKKKLADFLAKCCWEVQLKIQKELENGK